MTALKVIHWKNTSPWSYPPSSAEGLAYNVSSIYLKEHCARVRVMYSGQKYFREGSPRDSDERLIQEVLDVSAQLPQPVCNRRAS